MIGTCYNDKRRAPTFMPRHLDAYWKRVSNGLSGFGPEQLEEMIKGGVVINENGILSYADPSQVLTNKSNLDNPSDDCVSASEFFFSNQATNLSVGLLDDFVDFGSCSRLRMVEPQVIRIANKTRGKMACVWVIPGEAEGYTFLILGKPSFLYSQELGIFFRKAQLNLKYIFGLMRTVHFMDFNLNVSFISRACEALDSSLTKHSHRLGA